MTKPFIKITEFPIEPADELEILKDRASGAISMFLGSVRDENDSLLALHLEHYEGMTQAQITKIADKAVQKWSLNGLRVIHRVGRLLPEDIIVLVAASSAHRTDSIEAVHYVMDYLKTDAPFWKSEETADGSSWVDARDSDYVAKKKWQ